MSFFRNQSIIRKLVAGFALLMIVLGGVGVVTMQKLFLIPDNSQALLSNVGMLAATEEVLSGLAHEESVFRGFLLESGAPSAKAPAADVLAEEAEAGRQALAQLEARVNENPIQRQRFEGIGPLLESWRKGIVQKVAELVSKPDSASPEALNQARALEADGRKVLAGVRQKLGEIAQSALDGVESRSREEIAAVTRMTFLVRIGTIVSLIATAAVAWVLLRGIAHPVAEMVAAMSCIAQGETAVETFGVGREDEIGALGRAVDMFKIHVRSREEENARLLARQKKFEEELEGNKERLDRTVDAVGREADERMRAEKQCLEQRFAEERKASEERASQELQILAERARQELFALAERARAEREAVEQQLHHERQRTQDLVRNFELRIAGLVQTLQTSATEMETTAQSLSATAGTTNQNAAAAAAAAENAAAQVQAILAAAGTLASSIQDVGRETTEGITAHIAQVKTATRGVVTVVDGIGTLLAELRRISGEEQDSA